MQILLAILGLLHGQITYDTIGIQRTFSAGNLISNTSAPIHGIASPQFGYYQTMSGLDSVSGTSGQIVIVQNGGYNRPDFYWWDTSRYGSGSNPTTKDPKWMRINKHNNFYTIRQTTSMGTTNTISLKRIDSINNNTKGIGWEGIRSRDLKEKNVVYKGIASIAYRLNSTTDYIDISVRNSYDTSSLGVVRLNYAQNYVSLGYTVGQYAAGWVSWELYSNSNQQITAISDSAFFYIRICLSAYTNGSSISAPPKLIETTCDELPSMKISTLNDLPIGVYAKNSVANSVTYLGLNSWAIDQGTP